MILIMQHCSTFYLTLLGRFDNGSFPDWICHRAGLLNLSGWVKAQGDARVDVLVSGDADLVEAFEVACSLGPADIMVDRIDRKPGNLAQVEPGFARL